MNPAETYNLEPLKVRHADLERSSEESCYKSKCPECEDGVLLIRRDPDTAVLMAEDTCISCARRFIYEDIEDLRKKERPS